MNWVTWNHFIFSLQISMNILRYCVLSIVNIFLIIFTLDGTIFFALIFKDICLKMKNVAKNVNRKNKTFSEVDELYLSVI